MVITDYLTEDHIWLDFKAFGKDEALEALSDFAARLGGLESAEVLKVICDREKQGSTGLGGGVALPHSKTFLVKKPLLVVAVSPLGVPYGSIDGQPVHIIILMLTPLEGSEHLTLLGHLGRMFESEATVTEVMKAETAAQIYQIMALRDYQKAYP